MERGDGCSIEKGLPRSESSRSLTGLIYDGAESSSSGVSFMLDGIYMCVNICMLIDQKVDAWVVSAKRRF